MKPIRLLFVTRSFRGIGGMQLYTRTLLDALGERDDLRVSVVSMTGPKIFLPLFLAYAVLRSVAFRGDIIHIGDAALSSIALPPSLLRPKLRCTLTTYGLDVMYPHPFYQYVLRKSLPHVDCIVAISGATKKELSRRGVDPEHIVVIPCVVALPPLASSHRSRRQILLLGRQVRRKGTAWFLESVLPALVAHDPSISCVIAGDGPERSAIEHVLRTSAIHSHVRFLGEVDEATKEQLLSESTLFVMPNIEVPGDMEGFGLVCLEAAARGLPVVASAREGIVDAVVENVTGLFFRSGDPEDAVRVIQAALDQRWDTEKMRRAIEERYSPSVLASSYVSHVFASS